MAVGLPQPRPRSAPFAASAVGCGAGGGVRIDDSYTQSSTQSAEQNGNSIADPSTWSVKALISVSQFVQPMGTDPPGNPLVMTRLPGSSGKRIERSPRPDDGSGGRQWPGSAPALDFNSQTGGLWVPEVALRAGDGGSRPSPAFLPIHLD